MRASNVLVLSDDEICAKIAELTNKSREDVAIKSIKQQKFVCIKRAENQTDTGVHLRFFSFCNIAVEATLLRENTQITPYFKMLLEGEHGARVLIDLLAKEQMLRFTRDSYLHHHPKLMQLLERGIPGKYECTPHGAKVFLTKAEANQQFATIFAEPKVMNVIKFADDHFVLPYFTYAFLNQEKLVAAMAELVLNAPASAANQGPVVVILENECSESTCGHAHKPK